jgi:hypothetical protein
MPNSSTRFPRAFKRSFSSHSKPTLNQSPEKLSNCEFSRFSLTTFSKTATSSRLKNDHSFYNSLRQFYQEKNFLVVDAEFFKYLHKEVIVSCDERYALHK